MNLWTLAQMEDMASNCFWKFLSETQLDHASWMVFVFPLACPYYFSMDFLQMISFSLSVPCGLHVLSGSCMLYLYKWTLWKHNKTQKHLQLTYAGCGVSPCLVLIYLTHAMAILSCLVRVILVLYLDELLSLLSWQNHHVTYPCGPKLWWGLE